MALPNPDEYIRMITEDSYKQGIRDGIKKALENMIKYYEEDNSEKPCFQYMMDWPDNGCSGDCRQCIYEHLDSDKTDEE